MQKVKLGIRLARLLGLPGLRQLDLKGPRTGRKPVSNLNFDFLVQGGKHFEAIKSASKYCFAGCQMALWPLGKVFMSSKPWVEVPQETP